MAATAAPAKFTFDLDLTHARRSARVLDETELSKALERARNEGRAQGRSEAEAELAARAAAATVEAAREIARSAQIHARALEEALAGIRGEAATLADLIARKLAGHLVGRQPEVEIGALLADCLSSLDRVPHLVIRGHPDLADAIRETAERHAADLGFEGRLVIMGEPDIAVGDCRIEWADGGVVRDTAALEAAIAERIAAFAAGRPSIAEAAVPPPGDQP